MLPRLRQVGGIVLSRGIGLTLAFALLISLMLWSAFDLSRASAWIPQIVMGFTLAVLVLRLVVEIAGQPGKAQTPAPAARPGSALRALAALAWIGLLLVVAWLFGIALGSALFCATWLRFHARETWRLSLLFAGTAGAVLWLLFGVLPGSTLYRGIAWPFLSGALPAG